MADTKQQWYKDAKYGLFIHWGLYSILAGEWKDPKTGEVTKTDRIAEWIENNLNIDKEDYRKLKDEFHPDKFDADMFVKRAKEQWGVKYIVLTSKHHEGFAMYDSKVSDFNVVKAAGRDILRELSDACKKYDMTMGIYYSQAQDWDDDNAYKKDYEDKNEWKPEFRTYFDEKCKPQLKELLENYDNISLIWFDTPMGMTADEAQELRDWVKGIKPDCIISGRIGHQKGDYMTTGDNFIPRLPYDGDWEVPATVNDTWGYNKYDTNWKNPDDILNLLLKIVGRGGNYLLNVGPMADGTVPEACVEVMNEVGKYVTENAEAIYGTKNVGIYPYEIPSIEFTKRPHKLYVHVLAPRYRVELLNIGNQLKGAYVVSTGEKLALMWTFMLNPNFGIFNTIENIFGLHGTIPDVLTIKTVNVWIVVLVNEWMYAGYNMLIFAAGLVAIPDELNEAAALDGATGWQRIRYIILPLMKNSFKVFSILCITGCLKVFDIIWAMTRGGPNDISSTPSIMLYTQGFSYKLFGRSSAYGVILLVLGVVLSLVTNHLFREDKDLAM